MIFIKLSILFEDEQRYETTRNVRITGINIATVLY